MAKAKRLVQEDLWFCVQIDDRYNKPLYYKEIDEALHNVFENKAEIRVIGRMLDDNLLENGVENYVFIKCPEYKTYLAALRRLKYIECIVNSPNDIIFISQREIDNLTLSCKSQEKAYFFGDIVSIRNGVYGALSGIVIDSPIQEEINVLFKFNTHNLIISVKSENVMVQDNIFNKVKFPL